MSNCPECKSEDVRVAIHTDYKECNKCFHFWEESDKTLKRMSEQDFKRYLKEAREEFCKEVVKYNVSDNLHLRTACDSFLIAFDQVFEKYCEGHY